MLRPEIEERLIGLAHQNYQGARLAAGARGQARRGQARRLQPRQERIAARSRGPGRAGRHGRSESLELEISTHELESMSAAEVRRTLLNALDAQERPEMREMEKAVLLQILDSSWMEHLRAMDHLRSSIGLQGYAQIDPKVEYKREGMRIFAEMWTGIGDRVTDLIFRVEQFDPDSSTTSAPSGSSTAPRPSTTRPSRSSPRARRQGGVRQQQDAAIAGSQQSPEKKREPLRNLAKKVGRNDPCPCGSGKKFKACHMRKQTTGDPF